MPMRGVEAGFLSAVFGDQVYAKTTPNTVKSPQSSSSNVQSAENALTPSVSPVLVLQDKNSKIGTKDNTADDANVDVSNSALVPKVSSWGAFDSTDGADSGQTTFYRVNAGDTWSWIAAHAGVNEVTVNTVLWANERKITDKLVTGEILLIPPISGLVYEVKSGDTCASIAKTYTVDPRDITDYNNLGVNCSIKNGDNLFLPNAEKSPESSKPAKKSSISKDIQYYGTYPTQNTKSVCYSLPKFDFVNPVPGYRLSQGFHDGCAVDLAIAKGTPIHAAASGEVIFAKMGYNGGFGGLVIIVHSGGVKTMYGHMSKIIVNAGDPVAQNDIIGNVGSTGHSTGPHVHFVVEGAFNSGVNGSWKY